MKRWTTVVLLLLMMKPSSTASNTAAFPPFVMMIPKYTNTVGGITQYIQDVTPGIPKWEAKRLATLLVRVAVRHRVEPKLLAAIVRYESGGFRQNLKVCTSYGGCDSGLGQINEVHISDMRLDAHRLVFDDAYNLNIAAQLLAREKRDHPNDPRWWSNYHDHRDLPRRVWEGRVQKYVAAAYTELPRWGNQQIPK